MSRRIKAGTANVSVVIRIIDSGDGTPETGVTSAASGLALEYRRETAVSIAITESDLSALTDVHFDGGMLHIGNGYYRLDLPDGAVADGVTGVLVHGTATGMVVIGEYIELVDYDPYDGARLGLIALPNAAADAAGGLPISDAGGLDLDAVKVVTDKVDSAQTEPTGVPAANETPLEKLGFVFAALRNKLTVTGTKKQFFDDGGSALWEKDLTDDGTTYSESEGNAP